MRLVPDDLAVDPQPPGFTADIRLAKDGRALRWAATLQLPSGESLDVEYGLRLPAEGADKDEMGRMIESITATAWQSAELARLGHADLLSYITVGRHRNRPSRGRPLTPEAKELLAAVAKAHAERMAQKPPA